MFGSKVSLQHKNKKIFIPVHLSFTILFIEPGISKLISYQLTVKSF